MYKIFDNVAPFATLAEPIFLGSGARRIKFDFEGGSYGIDIKREHLGFGPKGKVYLTIKFNVWPHFQVEYMFEGTITPEQQKEIHLYDGLPRYDNVANYVFDTTKAVDSHAYLFDRWDYDRRWPEDNRFISEKRIGDILMTALLLK
jgi:hypothetical protein